MKKKQMLHYLFITFVIFSIFHMSTSYVQENIAEITIENILDDNNIQDEEKELFHKLLSPSFQVQYNKTLYSTTPSFHKVVLLLSPFKPPIS